MFASLSALFTGALGLIHVVRAVLPDVIVLADDVHNSLPAGTPTEQKVAHVETILRASLNTVQELPVSADQVIPALVEIVTSHLAAKLAPAPAASTAEPVAA